MSADRSGGARAREKGLAKEEAAARHLEVTGYTVLERNFHTRFGEIDIVARQGETVVFVEVRYRKANALVRAEESVTREKARRLRLAIRRYMSERNLPEAGVPVRVDLCVVRDCAGGRGGLSFEVIPGIIEFS